MSVRPLYGVEEFRKSRSMAGGMTGGLVLLALAVCLMTPSVKILTPPKAPSSIMLMRVIRPEPTPEAKPVQPDAMRKLLSPESEVTIPVPPPVVERPASAGGAQNGSSRTREAETGQESSSGENAAGGPAAGEARAAFRSRRPTDGDSSGFGGDGRILRGGRASGPGRGNAGTTGRQEQGAGSHPDALNRHKRYPKQARRIGAEGTVQLLVTISADGKVSACSLGKGSGRGARYTATERLGEKLVGLDIPSVRGGKGFQVLVPVRYSLKDA
ncbi:MAG: TonB family protein [Bilophila wadsworthia]